ncbi:MAG: hypothetical protein KTQ49_05230 [Candidatus Omnitrophica bacterium]|nr:hypothetical protein [Candidatus Omnitrophota bacterium]
MTRQSPFVFHHIYVDADARHEPLAARILNAFRGVPVSVVSDKVAFLKQAADMPLNAGKKVLWLTRFKGAFLKPCPATGPDYLCCRYWVINAQTHCPLDCSYCILQQYLNIPLITIFVNSDTVADEITSLVHDHPGRLFRMGTGELSDSLALDPISRVQEELLRSVAGKKVILEIKTKTDQVRHLPEIPKGNALVSWSLNPKAFIRTEEFKSAGLKARLRAACEAVQKGYRLGFHFDPLLMLPGWEKAYTALVRELTRSVPEQEVFWISLGSLRFPPALKKTLTSRFPKSLITSGEFIKGLDGKMRYFRPARTAMYRKVYGLLRERWKEVFVYFCMENKTVWRDVTGSSPEDNAHLDYLFHENLARRFPGLKLPAPQRENYPPGD